MTTCDLVTFVLPLWFSRTRPTPDPSLSLCSWFSGSRRRLCPDHYSVSGPHPSPPLEGTYPTSLPRTSSTVHPPHSVSFGPF